jgi:hypothetical protein
MQQIGIGGWVTFPRSFDPERDPSNRNCPDSKEESRGWRRDGLLVHPAQAGHLGPVLVPLPAPITRRPKLLTAHVNKLVVVTTESRGLSLPFPSFWGLECHTLRADRQPSHLPVVPSKRKHALAHFGWPRRTLREECFESIT